jgi:hypothetical protein
MPLNRNRHWTADDDKLLLELQSIGPLLHFNGCGAQAKPGVD